MSEETRKLEEAIRQEFQRLFPLVPERDLPWYPTHIGRFLKERFDTAVDRSTRDRLNDIAAVLGEVTDSRFAVDMARKVVDELKAKRRFMQSLLADLEVNIKRYSNEPEAPTPSSAELVQWLTAIRKRLVDSGTLDF